MTCLRTCSQPEVFQDFPLPETGKFSLEFLGSVPFPYLNKLFMGITINVPVV
jgi:hypothetical protein